MAEFRYGLRFRFEYGIDGQGELAMEQEINTDIITKSNWLLTTIIYLPGLVTDVCPLSKSITVFF